MDTLTEPLQSHYVLLVHLPPRKNGIKVIKNCIYTKLIPIKTTTQKYLFFKSGKTIHMWYCWNCTDSQNKDNLSFLSQDNIHKNEPLLKNCAIAFFSNSVAQRIFLWFPSTLCGALNGTIKKYKLSHKKQALTELCRQEKKKSYSSKNWGDE